MGAPARRQDNDGHAARPAISAQLLRPRPRSTPPNGRRTGQAGTPEHDPSSFASAGTAASSDRLGTSRPPSQPRTDAPERKAYSFRQTKRRLCAAVTPSCVLRQFMPARKSLTTTGDAHTLPRLPCTQTPVPTRESSACASRGTAAYSEQHPLCWVYLAVRPHGEHLGGYRILDQALFYRSRWRVRHHRRSANAQRP